MPREVTKNAIRSGGEVRTRRAAMPSASSQEIRGKPGSPRRRSIGYGRRARARRFLDDMERRAFKSSRTRMSRGRIVVYWKRFMRAVRRGEPFILETRDAA